MQITKVPAGTVIRQRAGISFMAYSIEYNATAEFPVIVRDEAGHPHHFRSWTNVIVPVGTEPLA